MKLAKDISVAAFAVAISVAAVAKPTQAALVNYGFTVNATSGDNPGQYFGSFQYDDSTLTGIGEETLGVSNGLSILFNYLGTQYTETSDFDYPISPAVRFTNGNLSGLSYLVEDQFFIGNDPGNPNTGGTKFYSILSADLLSTTEVGTVTYTKSTPVPEPMTVGGIAIAGAMALGMKRKKKVFGGTN
ncbi:MULTISPECIES: PEP-CTERM sorting domain-containing protein [Nostoc]|uniref:PEP-CTERM sorting domain-containing protein n=1 Tax=Nostoc paludosum FACHB-159 TaxID=2692908 RepID=A0ABR8KH21_9NOSO|nr:MULTISPECIES: PEP-CTERM sorting domain-containing protein [Nostoc]MBD2682515.1 PEP-CTERM sorting domain-containing protein [Nostoc sp. FACHB-857]MBD2738846.1 PEP-CTERM sorting domain-containing protein [Nostoc paludosum FACHB-159]